VLLNILAGAADVRRSASMKVQCQPSRRVKDM